MKKQTSNNGQLITVLSGPIGHILTTLCNIKNKRMNKILFLLLTIYSIDCQAQEIEKFNLGFENQSKKTSLTDGWFKCCLLYTSRCV